MPACAGTSPDQLFGPSQIFLCMAEASIESRDPRKQGVRASFRILFGLVLGYAKRVDQYHRRHEPPYVLRMGIGVELAEQRGTTRSTIATFEPLNQGPQLLQSIPGGEIGLRFIQEWAAYASSRPVRDGETKGLIHFFTSMAATQYHFRRQSRRVRCFLPTKPKRIRTRSCRRLSTSLLSSAATKIARIETLPRLASFANQVRCKLVQQIPCATRGRNGDTKRTGTRPASAQAKSN